MVGVRKTFAILSLLAVAAIPAFAGSNSLEFVYNCFIDRFADGNPAWKTEITLGADLDKPPQPPYRLHYHGSLGYYTYRPKHWTELNDYERFALRNDPRLPAFIRENALSLRAGQFGASAVPANARQTALTTGDSVSADSQAAGVLTREGENTWGYRFEPGDLLNSKPLRLVEVP